MNKDKVSFHPSTLPSPYHLRLKAGIHHDHRISGFTCFLIFYLLAESSVYKRAKFLLNFASIGTTIEPIPKAREQHAWIRVVDLTDPN